METQKYLKYSYKDTVEPNLINIANADWSSQYLTKTGKVVDRCAFGRTFKRLGCNTLTKFSSLCSKSPNNLEDGIKEVRVWTRRLAVRVATDYSHDRLELLHRVTNSMHALVDKVNKHKKPDDKLSFNLRLSKSIAEKINEHDSSLTLQKPTTNTASSQDEQSNTQPFQSIQNEKGCTHNSSEEPQIAPTTNPSEDSNDSQDAQLSASTPHNSPVHSTLDTSLTGESQSELVENESQKQASEQPESEGILSQGSLPKVIIDVTLRTPQNEDNEQGSTSIEQETITPSTETTMVQPSVTISVSATDKNNASEENGCTPQTTQNKHQEQLDDVQDVNDEETHLTTEELEEMLEEAGIYSQETDEESND